ncbi:Large tegument protein deneddylase [Labeo rohita]|uniref:Large tegument protein deneddylase n=1 Tax=Labeo rohita TaxID=84645 RepID=A0ABQ8KZL4_LABRO|nr:Large tegument protein deneddylase [Labeo rohita]
MSDENPYVLSVKASHCQSDVRYSVYSRGRQCTCNSLMFLAVHNERNELQSFDLDGILQKGDAVYTSVKRALQKKKGKFVGNFLNFDELPKTIETNSRCYNVLKHPQRFGFLRDTPALGNYANLENTLQCLRADVSDALLLCGGSCIAVFRDRSGRFGYFDSHSRSIYGMPVDEGAGTAVFLTFHQFQDLVDRLLILYQGCFDLRDQEEFELLPVSFISMLPERCVHTKVSQNCCDLEHEMQPSVSFENKSLSNNEQCTSIDVLQHVQVQDLVRQLSETAVSEATSTDEQAHLTEVSLNCCDLKYDVQPSVSLENKSLSSDEQCSSADFPRQYVQVQDPVQELSETAVSRATSTDEQAPLTEVSLNCCDLEYDVQPSFLFENKALSGDEQCLSADFPQQYVQVQDPVQQLSKTAVNGATSTDEQAHLIYQDKKKVQTSVTQNQEKYKDVPLSELYHSILSQDQLAMSALNHQHSKLSIKQTKKLNKTRKRKAYYKKWHEEMVQRQGVHDKKQAVRQSL